MFSILNNTIRLTRGDTARFDIVVKNPDGTVYTPVEGDVITFTVKPSAGKSATFTKTGASIVINPTDTANLANGDYVYDVDIKLANGDVNTIITESGFILGVNV
jgi:hypothetical protein